MIIIHISGRHSHIQPTHDPPPINEIPKKPKTHPCRRIKNFPTAHNMHSFHNIQKKKK